MFNPGAFQIKTNFLSELELQKEVDSALALYNSKTRTHSEDSKYGNIDWFQVPLKADSQVLQKILKYFDLNFSDVTLAVLYYLEPGAIIHPHRDLTGASVNDRIRFHVPLITSKQVSFSVNGEEIYMAPGELWILDTSYEHAVKNEGKNSRVHVVLEAKLNKKTKNMLPSGVKAKLHTVNFLFWAASKTFSAIFINTWRDPSYAKVQLTMAFKYLVDKIFRKY